MKVNHIYLSFDDEGKPKHCTATISVPGLGRVEIGQPISNETAEIVKAESVQALRILLKQKLEGIPE